jgi:hypothetical protein
VVVEHPAILDHVTRFGAVKPTAGKAEVDRRSLIVAERASADRRRSSAEPGHEALSFGMDQHGYSSTSKF